LKYHNQIGGEKSMADFNGNWFKVREIVGRVWAIDDNGWDTIYLVAGEKRRFLLIRAGVLAICQV
jgi:hypothetical protein